MGVELTDMNCRIVAKEGHSIVSMRYLDESKKKPMETDEVMKVLVKSIKVGRKDRDYVREFINLTTLMDKFLDKDLNRLPSGTLRSLARHTIGKDSKIHLCKEHRNAMDLDKLCDPCRKEIEEDTTLDIFDCFLTFAEQVINGAKILPGPLLDAERRIRTIVRWKTFFTELIFPLLDKEKDKSCMISYEYLVMKMGEVTTTNETLVRNRCRRRPDMSSFYKGVDVSFTKIDDLPKNLKKLYKKAKTDSFKRPCEYKEITEPLKKSKKSN